MNCLICSLKSGVFDFWFSFNT